ncbi:AP2-like ethylene-responsive transcription factor At1g16060 [Lolium perenne]|uniref:AP2-like ethylene-responsive transcription factor At1g16060 n=1 Tax=Lolium perenne TaxID=4522 RepID=UPI0021F599BF|nr:AP2-like ethylene-responsive transcription factor At1g16060 [Lolium perenne]
MTKQRQNSASIAGEAGATATARLKPKRTRKSVPRECPSQRTSVYRGVTRHRWTGRFEAHLWDKNTWSEPQRKKKGRQVYLGAYGGEEAAARAYDLAALKYWGRDTILNFPLSNYDQEWKEMEEQSREEYIGSLRRKSTGFSRGVSKYRGVARHHHNGKWEARIGRVFGNKYLYLGTYATQEEAAMAYDIAAIEHRGLNAVTNFDVSSYIKWHHLCRAGDAEGLQGPGQLPVDMAPHPTVDLDEAMAAAALHKHEDGQLLPTHVSPPSHAALGLLLQSPGFKEMIERSVASEGSTRSPSSSSCSPSPPSPPALTQQQQQEPEYSGGASSGRCSFPDDVQTYFGCEDHDHDGGVGYAEVDTFLFGDLGAYAAPMFQFELDV